MFYFIGSSCISVSSCLNIPAAGNYNTQLIFSLVPGMFVLSYQLHCCHCQVKHGMTMSDKDLEWWHKQTAPQAILSWQFKCMCLGVFCCTPPLHIDEISPCWSCQVSTSSSRTQASSAPPPPRALSCPPAWAMPTAPWCNNRLRPTPPTSHPLRWTAGLRATCQETGETWLAALTRFLIYEFCNHISYLRKGFPEILVGGLPESGGNMQEICNSSSRISGKPGHFANLLLTYALRVYLVVLVLMIIYLCFEFALMYTVCRMYPVCSHYTHSFINLW